MPTQIEISKKPEGGFIVLGTPDTAPQEYFEGIKLRGEAMDLENIAYKLGGYLAYCGPDLPLVLNSNDIPEEGLRGVVHDIKNDLKGASNPDFQYAITHKQAMAGLRHVDFKSLVEGIGKTKTGSLYRALLETAKIFGPDKAIEKVMEIAGNPGKYGLMFVKSGMAEEVVIKYLKRAYSHTWDDRYIEAIKSYGKNSEPRVRIAAERALEKIAEAEQGIGDAIRKKEKEAFDISEARKQKFIEIIRAILKE